MQDGSIAGKWSQVWNCREPYYRLMHVVATPKKL